MKMAKNKSLKEKLEKSIFYDLLDEHKPVPEELRMAEKELNKIIGVGSSKKGKAEEIIHYCSKKTAQSIIRTNDYLKNAQNLINKNIYSILKSIKNKIESTSGEISNKELSNIYGEVVSRVLEFEDRYKEMKDQISIVSKGLDCLCKCKKIKRTSLQE